MTPSKRAQEERELEMGQILRAAAYLGHEDYALASCTLPVPDFQLNLVPGSSMINSKLAEERSAVASTCTVINVGMASVPTILKTRWQLGIQASPQN
jgi:hypothetical protein